jgi:coproporphyrinogen III oxidase-like Fe-S oxidoreductase
MTKMTEEEITKLTEEIDAVVDEIMEVLTGHSQGVGISAFGRIIGTTATNWVDLVRRCNAIAEMGAVTFYEDNGPTEH